MTWGDRRVCDRFEGEISPGASFCGLPREPDGERNLKSVFFRTLHGPLEEVEILSVTCWGRGLGHRVKERR